MLTVVFEGANKVGKSTLMREFNKRTGYIHTCIDRAHISQFVYSMMRRNGGICKDTFTPDDVLGLVELSVELARMDDSLHIVLVRCSEESRQQRLRNTDGDSPENEVQCFDTVVRLLSMLNPDLHIHIVSGDFNTLDEAITALTENLK